MPVIQEAFFIPPDIATGLAIGLYRRLGGVVRYAVGPHKGQIVKHLKPVDIPVAEEAIGLAEKAINILKNNKKALIIGVAVAVVGGSTAVYYGIRNHEPAVVSDFRKALSNYVEAIRAGTMETEKITALMVALDRMKAHKNYETFRIKLSAEDLHILVNRIYDYTAKLAKDNGFEPPAHVENNEGAIINLRNFLKMQKTIFESVA